MWLYVGVIGAEQFDGAIDGQTFYLARRSISSTTSQPP